MRCSSISAWLILGAFALAPTSAGIAAPADSGMDMQMDMDHAPAHHHTHAAFGFGVPASAKQATRTVKIAILDSSFAPPTLTAAKGEVIHFVITNTSQADHEFVLGDAATQSAHRAEMAKMAAEGKSMTHSHANANAIAVAAGQTGTLTWRFTRTGAVEYGCNIPGHYEAGMHGLVTVK